MYRMRPRHAAGRDGTGADMRADTSDEVESRLSWLTILGIAIGLAMDAVAVAVGVGLVIPQLTARHVFRMAFHFALFQFMMPVVGWSAGRSISRDISAYDHWIAFGLLAFIGGKMIWEAFSGHPTQGQSDPTRGWRLFMLSIATSIDALAVGVSMAFLRISIWMPSLVIGLVTAVLTVAGICFAGKVGRRFGMWADLFGGVVLIAIGARILISHHFGG